MVKQNKSAQELTPVEKDILACYEKGQPVLLYGNDSIDLDELIERIKRIYCEHNPYLDREGLIKRSDLEGVLSFESNYYIDCGDMNGKEVYEALVGCSESFSLEGGLLLKEHGDLIIDNLHCNPEKDEKDYRKLAKIIKERQRIHYPTTFNWLVAYAHDDPQSFPTYFIEQFGEPILLDGELKESIKMSRKIALKHIGKEPKNEVGLQIRGITKKRGRKPKNEKYYEFISILDSILSDDKNDSLGGYVIKVKEEMARQGLKERKVDKKTGLERENFIYADSTIKTYIQDHPEYKKIQKRKEKRKKV